MPEASSTCPHCGEPIEPGKGCLKCTVTDIKLASLADLKASARQKPDAYLVDSHSGNKIEITSRKWKIGRDPTNHLITAEDTYTSRFHAFITYEEGHYFIEDLGSTNGTLVNDEPLLRRRHLVNRDLIRIGRSEYTFVRGANTGVQSASQSVTDKRQ